MAEEQTLVLHLDRRRLNFITSIMPTLEGLFLASVIDGQAGTVKLQFSPTVAEEVADFVRYVEAMA